MPPPTLSNRQTRELSRASRSSVVDAAARLAGYTTRGRWLGNNNRYAEDTLSRIKDDFNNSSMRSKHASEFLAASAPSHCIDGWSFLGRALACHFVGDADSARHLGYYAELRAGAALLATAGIGVLNNPHIVIDPAGSAHRLAGHNTHVMMWLALEHWANSADAADVLGVAITPASIPIATWLGNMPGGSVWQPIGKDWLLSLGLDLKYLAEDREARNRASYRPSHLPKTRATLDAPAAARFAIDLWRVLEPTTYRAFDHLDLHFLRQTIEIAFRSVRGRTPRQAPRLYEREVDITVGSTIGFGLHADSIQRFLQRGRKPDDAALVTAARGGSDDRQPRHHLHVLARAALLLRIATGATRALLDDAGIGFTDVEFWWESIGRSRGLWEQTPDPLMLPDRWADVEDALRRIEDWLDVSGGSYLRLRSDCADSFAVLGGAEIVGLWGLAS